MKTRTIGCRFGRGEARPRVAYMLGLLLACVAGNVMGKSFALVSHNGFQSCWSDAITLDTFLQQISTRLEGQPVCLPAASDGSSCATSTCSGGVPGCEVTLHAGEIVTAQLPVGDGIARFDSRVGFDPFSMPLVVPTVGTCTLNVLDTTDAVLSYSLYVPMRNDGNDGRYTFDPVVFNSTLTGLAASDLSLTGGFSCQFANLSLAYFVGTLTDQLAIALADTLPPLADGESICPRP
jgi:hypothetical protein